MARIRTIKPEFWEDEKVGLLSHGARLLFLCCLNLSDDEGLLRWNAYYLASHAFMYDEVRIETMEKWMNELTGHDLVRVYQAGLARQKIGFIMNFRRHQRIDRPVPSRFPMPEADAALLRLIRPGADLDGADEATAACRPCVANEANERGCAANHSANGSTSGSTNGSTSDSTNDSTSNSTSGSTNDSTNGSTPEQGTGKGNREQGKGTGKGEETPPDGGSKKPPRHEGAPASSPREPGAASESPGPVAVDYEGIVQAWNVAAMGRLPVVTVMTESRRAALRARCAEHGAGTVLEVIRRACRSRFLCGGNDRDWRADFDWVMRPRNFVRILEGNYDETSQNATHGAGVSRAATTTAGRPAGRLKDLAEQILRGTAGPEH